MTEVRGVILLEVAKNWWRKCWARESRTESGYGESKRDFRNEGTGGGWD